MAAKILIIHGPNMNLLGARDRTLYGSKTLDEINGEIMKEAANSGLETLIEQRNSEGEIIDIIHHHCTGDLTSPGKVQGLIINPAAYSHYSVAMRDAIEAVDIPVVEVHMTNVAGRSEGFRQNFVTGAVCDGVIAGFGSGSYILAVSAIKNLISK